MKSAVVKTMADEKGRDHCSLIFGCVFGLREVVGQKMRPTTAVKRPRETLGLVGFGACLTFAKLLVRK
jgi:hypothetical protein